VRAYIHRKFFRFVFYHTTVFTLTTTIPEHMSTAFVLYASLKKELKELLAVCARGASFKPLSAGRYATLFFCGDPRWGLEVGVGDGRDGCDGCDGGDGGGGDGARASRWW
jgi:hypothetical protein